MLTVVYMCKRNEPPFQLSQLSINCVSVEKSMKASLPQSFQTKR